MIQNLPESHDSDPAWDQMIQILPESHNLDSAWVT